MLRSRIPHPLVLGLPGLPGVPDWVKERFGDIGEFINPFAYFAKSLRAIYGMLTWFFETIIRNPIRFAPSDALDYLYGNSMGLSMSLVVLVTVILMSVAMFKTSFMVSFLEAVIIGILIITAAPLWFSGTDQAMRIGDQLNELALFYTPKNNPNGAMDIAIDSATSPVLMIIAFFPTVVLGGINVFIVYLYEALNIFIKFAGLPLLALRPLNKKIAALSNWTISAALVSMVFGRFVMLLCIEIGQLLGDTVLGGSTAGVVFFLCAGFVLSIWLQKKLYEQAKSVVGKVTGRTRSHVTGKVEAIAKSKPTISGLTVNQLHARTMSPVPIPVYTEQGKASTVSRSADFVATETKAAMRAQARKAIAKRAAGVVATTGAAYATGGTSLAVQAGAAAASSAASKPTAPPQEETTRTAKDPEMPPAITHTPRRF